MQTVEFIWAGGGLFSVAMEFEVFGAFNELFWVKNFLLCNFVLCFGIACCLKLKVFMNGGFRIKNLPCFCNDFSGVIS
jgi:hypothetical protein